VTTFQALTVRCAPLLADPGNVSVDREGNLLYYE